MNKTKKNINVVLTIILLLVLIFIVYSVIFPIFKARVIEGEENANISLIEGDKDVFSFELADDYVNALMFYASANVNDIEFDVSIYAEEDLVYKNRFTSLNRSQNIIYLRDPLIDIEEVKIEYEVVKSSSEIILSTSEDGHILFDQISREKTYRPTLWAIIIFETLLLALLFINKETLDKKIHNKKKFIAWIIYACVWISTAILSLYLVYEANFKEALTLWKTLILLIDFSLGIFLAAYLFPEKMQYEKLFLIIGIPLACFYCVFCMPEDAFDEYKHYGRAYATASGDLIIPNTIEMPVTLEAWWLGHGTVKNLFTKMLETTDYSDTKPVGNIANTYNPILYIFPSIAIFIGKTLNLNLYVGWYLGKIFNMIFFWIMGYLTIKKMPRFKLLTLLYLLMPMTLYLVTSVSCDAMIISCSLYLIAHMLNINYTKREFKLWDFLIFILLGFIMITTKPIYFPILLGLLIINYKSLLSNKKQLIYSILSILIIGGLYLLWQYMNTTETVNNPDGIMVGNLGVNYVISHPFSTISTLLNYFISSADYYLLDFVGYRFIWQTVSVPISYSAAYLFAMFMASLIREDKDDYPLLEKVVFVICGLGASALAVLAMYMFEYRSNMLTNTVWGVQGRYFIPIFILLFICMNKLSLKGKTEGKTKMILVASIIIQILYIVQLIDFVIS